ncbi:MAG: zinc ribbon domain-containing protein [Firmicutes bacterium]|nr:zinc ribbon domain-containing protein [Bacillota bacterium]
MGNYCPKCGSQVTENQDFCLNCGKALSHDSNDSSSGYSVNEGSTIGFGVLGFFIPLAGIILFIIWKDKRPKASKSAGIGAVIGFVGAIIYGILMWELMSSL